MTIPDWLHAMEDGLYGSVDALLASFQEGRELAAWHQRVAENALSEVKIACWLHSDAYRERHSEPAEGFAPGRLPRRSATSAGATQSAPAGSRAGSPNASCPCNA